MRHPQSLASTPRLPGINRHYQPKTASALSVDPWSDSSVRAVIPTQNLRWTNPLCVTLTAHDTTGNRWHYCADGVDRRVVTGSRVNCHSTSSKFAPGVPGSGDSFCGALLCG